MRASHGLALLIIALTAATSIHVLVELTRFVGQSIVEVLPTMVVSAGETVLVELPEVRRGDRVYLVLDGRVNVEERGVRPIEAVELPLMVETFEHDVFPSLVGERRYMFVVREDSEKAFLMLRLQPMTSYVIKSIEGHMGYRVLGRCEGGLVCVQLSPVRFSANGYSQIAFVYPLRQVAEEGFRVRGFLKLVNGTLDYVNVVVMTERGWYAHRVADSLTPPGTAVLFEASASAGGATPGWAGLVGERLYAVAVSVGLSKATCESSQEVIIGIGGLVIENGRSLHFVEPEVHETYVLKPRVYVLRKFQPTEGYLVSIGLLTVLLMVLALISAGAEGALVGLRLRR